MGDKVVHDYPELDLDLLWDTLVHGMPILHSAITGCTDTTRPGDDRRD